jgi:hypothetical protein
VLLLLALSFSFPLTFLKQYLWSWDLESGVLGFGKVLIQSLFSLKFWYFFHHAIFVFIFTVALLRYNSHAIKLVPLKCPIHWVFLIH